MEENLEAIENEKRIVEIVKRKIETRRTEDMKAVVGLDGFIDEIVHVVDKRADVKNYTRMETIMDLSERLRSAAGRSSNIELVTHKVKIGGNGPIMANCVNSLGPATTYIGNLGYPEIHPVFRKMASRCHIISLAEPAHTDALEFNDGKIMLGKMDSLEQLTWQRLTSVVSLENLVTMIDECDLLALVNWTMISNMTDIWENLISKVLPKLYEGKRRTAFFDLADPEKRTREDIRKMLSLIPKFSSKFDVVFGLNEREARQIASALGMPENALGSKFVNEICQFIAGELKIHCVVVHPVKYAVATSGDKTFHQDGPHTATPKITTGAGDHFNAAFCIGMMLGLEPDACLLMGVCCSGFYVFTARTPTFDELLGFMENWRNEI